MFSALSAENVDPFYPAVYADVTNPDAVVEKVDNCLGHPQVQGVYHYHSASTCIANKTYYENQTEPINQDIKTLMEFVWLDKPYRSAIGVSKDGRPILSPYYNNGTAYTDCEVDVCNGITINGHYMYATTFFHPYFMGCYGKGSSPELYQQCSTNPRLCNVVYEDFARSKMAVSFFVALASFMLATVS